LQSQGEMDFIAGLKEQSFYIHIRQTHTPTYLSTISRSAQLHSDQRDFS